MANVGRLVEERRRAKMATTALLVDRKLLRKKLLKIYYAETVNEIMKIVDEIEGVVFEEQPKGKGMTGPHKLQLSDLEEISGIEIRKQVTRGIFAKGPEFC